MSVTQRRLLILFSGLLLLFLGPCCGAGGIVMDDADGTGIGTWKPSKGPDPYGAGSQWTENTGDTFVWSAEIEVPGPYEVSAWWTVYGTRPDNAPYRVEQNGQTAAAWTADQTANGGKWNRLGTVNLDAGPVEIILTDVAEGAVSADAVRLDLVPHARAIVSRWDPVPDTDLAGYEIGAFHSPPTPDAVPAVSALVPPDVTQGAVGPLALDTTYHFAVRAIDDIGQTSAWSESFEAHTGSLVDDIPTVPGGSSMDVSIEIIQPEKGE